MSCCLVWNGDVLGLDYLPLYFQAIKGHSPLRSGVDMLEISLSIAPVAYVQSFPRFRLD